MIWKYRKSQKKLSLKETESSKYHKVSCPDNPGQNIGIKIE